MDLGACCTRAASARGVRHQTNHAPHPTKNANIPHDRTQFVHPSPPCSAKSNSTAQSKTVDVHAERAIPANASPTRGLSLNPVSASAMNAPHTHPTNHPHSTNNVRCEPTSVRTVIPSSNRNDEASIPERPSPTPPGFAAKSRSPASQIRGRFRIESSSTRRGTSHHRDSPATASPTITHRPLHQKGMDTMHAARRFTSNNQTATSRPATRSPVREYVIKRSTNRTPAKARPSQACHRHPQHSGNSAHSAAAVWFGLWKPRLNRTRPLQVNSSMAPSKISLNDTRP